MSHWLDEHGDLAGGATCADMVLGRRPRGATSRGCTALRAQVASPVVLPGTGLPSRRLRFVPRLCPAAVGVEFEEVGLAQEDQRDPGATL